MPSLTEIEGIGPSLAAACVKCNYRTIAKIAASGPNELSAVPGISKKSAALIIASAKSLMPKPRIPSNSTKNKKRAVAPVKVGKNTVGVPAPARPADTSSGKSERKSAKTSAAKTPGKETKMSAPDIKKKIKKLKKKIKKLKAEKKKILANDKKKLKKAKLKKKQRKKN